MLHFYPTLKNGGAKHDFFVLLNAPVGVHERPKNLLTRIGIRDSTFCDNVFHNFLRFLKIMILQKELFYNNFCNLLYYLYIILLFYRTSLSVCMSFSGWFGISRKKKTYTQPPTCFQCNAWHINCKIGIFIKIMTNFTPNVSSIASKTGMGSSFPLLFWFQSKTVTKQRKGRDSAFVK